MVRMKKIAILLLLSIYSLASFGIGVNSFYCCGKLKSVTLSFFEKNVQVPADNSNSSCCQTKHQFLQVHDTHIAASIAHFYISPDLALPSPFINKVPLFTTTIGQEATTAHAPPLSVLPPLYILHCVYRI